MYNKYSQNPPISAKETMPTMYDLPSELVGESGLPDEFHCIQADLLTETCQLSNYTPSEMLIATDLNLYYDPQHLNWYKRPDWFIVLGVENQQQQEDLRLSYVIWQEEISPFVIVELLSPGTEEEDLGKTLREVNKPPTKWEVYERILKIPYYVIYDRYENNLRIFKHNGTRYQRVKLSKQRFWLEEIEMGLGLWQGTYQHIEGLWLRWYNADGWLSTFAEKAESERQRAELERQRAEEERTRAENEKQRADKLAEYLRSLNIDPDSLS